MTKIEWTDRVWNPVTGCSKVSQGCKNCYAERIANRHLPQGGFAERPFTEVRCHLERLDQPLHWRKPSRVFVNSMSDLFHPDVPFEFILACMARMVTANQHTYQILTKRPARLLEFVNWTQREGATYSVAWRDNIWLGVSVENQKAADERIPLLLQTPASVRFLSVEPMLGPVDLSEHLKWRDYDQHSGMPTGDMLHWVICGGESGPGARPFNLDWATSLLAQCKAAGVPFFMKQIGSNPSIPKETFYRNTKGGDMDEWPANLRVREFPRDKPLDSATALA